MDNAGLQILMGAAAFFLLSKALFGTTITIRIKDDRGPR